MKLIVIIVIFAVLVLSSTADVKKGEFHAI